MSVIFSDSITPLASFGMLNVVQNQRTYPIMFALKDSV